MGQIIVIGGVGRSGTSILSQLLASTRNTEFFYEPPVLMHLLETIQSMPKGYDWRSLFNTVIYKDLFKGAISGRALNHNKFDISSAFHYKDEEEIHSRLEKSFRQDDLDLFIDESNILIKVLDNVAYISELRNYCNNARAVIIIRNPGDVIRSIKEKAWFSNSSLSITSPEPLRYMHIFKNYRIHIFVPEEMREAWIAADENDRIAYYYRNFYQKFIQLLDNQDVVFVDYDKFIKNPEGEFERISSIFNLIPGCKTKAIINSIGIRNKATSKDIKEFEASRYFSDCIELYTELKEQIK